jgi:hypothetical protein
VDIVHSSDLGVTTNNDGIKVKATREGHPGNSITAIGWTIDDSFPFVALPSHKALGRWIKITNPLNGKQCCAQVRDVGPFNTNDDAYVEGGKRPAAEAGVSISGEGTNGAGVDLGECVWKLLDMRDNTQVIWKFII